MLYCPNCNAPTEEGRQFCTNCGAKLNPQQPNYQQSVYQQPTIPPQYKPLGAWTYFGYSLLFAIPLVGFILTIVFACGGTQNINLRNWCRSFFCWYIVFAALIIILLIAGVNFSYYLPYYF